MNLVHDGVMIPADMTGAPVAELDAYAERVRRGNQAFVAAVFAVEDAAVRAGVVLPT
jgi:hypothetical protein